MRLEAHLRECAPCRRRLTAEQALKAEIHAAGRGLEASPALRERIASAVASSRFTQALPAARDHSLPLMRPAAAAVAALLMLGLPVLYWMKIAVAAGSRPIFVEQRVPLIRAASEDQLVERLIETAGGSLKPMGYDLTELGVRPVAGALREIGGRKVLVAIYRGPDRWLLCYTVPGSEQDAPAHAARFIDENKKMTFFAFSHETVNAVLHREGDVICILAADMPIADLLALTRSKARAH